MGDACRLACKANDIQLDEVRREARLLIIVVPI